MMHFLLAAALGAASNPGASDAVNQGYKDLSAARLAGDTAAMASFFPDDALLIDSRPAPALTGSSLAAQLAPMVARLKADGVTATSHYRIEQRTIIDDVVIDAGFMKMQFVGAVAQPGKPMPRDMIRRFMVTWKKSPQGKWQIIGDANFPATQEQFDAAKPQPGLYYN